MKIGILTHHYVKNFGAYMQAKALLSVINEIYPDFQVEIIDYCIKKHEISNSAHFFGFRPKRGDTISGFIEKIKLFFTFRKIENTLPHSVKVNSAKEISKLGYDLVFIGSDEVWNFNDISYSPIKFGEGLLCECVTYAASAGGSTVNDINIPAAVKKGISNFKKISVRDEKTEELVTRLGSRKAVRTLDPVFLYNYKLTASEQINKIVSQRPYVLLYDCKLDRKQTQVLINYAKLKGLQVLGAGEYRNWYATTATTNITPYEWAYLFKNATAVVTGTFHGTSFAIKYNRPFVAYLTEQNRINKVSSLLSEFGLEDRIVVSEKKMVEILSQPIDYKHVNKIIQERKKTSIDYIRECIDEVK